MARNTQLIEIDLRSGVTSNASLYEIGPRLWKATNSAWNYRYPRVAGLADVQAWTHRQPLTFPLRNALTFTGAKSFRDIGFIFNVDFDKFTAMIGCNASDQYAVWKDTGGSEYPFAGGVTRSTVSASFRTLGCSATWANPGKDPNGGAALPADEGVMVFSHPDASHVYYLLNSGASIRSLTSDVSNCPAGAAALAVHLDRLWLLESSGSQTSKAWYTDPLNLDSVRTTNVVQVVGDGTCLVPGQYGAIDTSGVPHLIIGCKNSVYVLDGDPILGGGLQANLRTLRVGVGMLSSHAAALTPFGVFFLGSDGDLWQIPTGAQQMGPVGGGIRNQLGRNNQTGALDIGSVATGTLAWLDPYLYVFPGGETTWALVFEPSDRGITAWGPVTMSTLSGREAVVRTPPDQFALRSPSGIEVASLHSVDTVPVAGAARYLVVDPFTAQTGAYPGGSNLLRTPSVTTGLINVPGHAVQAMRVILEILRQPLTSTGGTPAWTVTVTDERGNVVTARRLPEAAPAVGTNAQTVTTTLHYAVPPLTASRGVQVHIQGIAEQDLGLHRALVELRTTPSQF